MTRSGIVLLVVAACSHPAPPKDVPQLPPDPSTEAPAPTADATKPKPPEAPKPPPPPPPKEPHDATIPAVTSTVKVVSAGAGKRAKIVIGGAAKQPLDVTFGFTIRQNEVSQKLPEIVLHTDAEATAAGADGTAYKLVVTKVDTRDVSGETRPERFEEQLAPFVGMTISGTVKPDGTTTDTHLHLDLADPRTAGTMDHLFAPGLLSLWPVVPTEPIAPGAKWTVTSTRKVVDLEVTQVTQYELVSAKGGAYEIKGTTSVTGKDQTLEGAPVSQIGGDGTFTTKSTGGLFSTTHTDVSAHFTATVPPQDGQPGGTLTMEMKFANDAGAPPKNGSPE